MGASDDEASVTTRPGDQDPPRKRVRLETTKEKQHYPLTARYNVPESQLNEDYARRLQAINQASGSDRGPKRVPKRRRPLQSPADDREALLQAIRRSTDKLFFIWHVHPTTSVKRWYLVQAHLPSPQSIAAFRRTGIVRLRWFVR